MMAYIYQAALLCSPCGREAIQGLTGVVDSEDSDQYPQGPISAGGGESDSPAHCDSCHEFLRNPLTADGVNYVRGLIEKNPTGEAIQEWAEFYKEVL
jgi:hypothetical protein